jgi:hypothetical protein
MNLEKMNDCEKKGNCPFEPGICCLDVDVRLGKRLGRPWKPSKIIRINMWELLQSRSIHTPEGKVKIKKKNNLKKGHATIISNELKNFEFEIYKKEEV